MSGANESRIATPESRLHDDKILILDFGAQYTQLIARRIREIGVYCEIWAWDHDPEEIAKFGAKGIILSGGPESTTQHGAPAAPQQVFDSGLPILGICYGMQTLAAQLGGATEAADAREFGHAEVQLVAHDALPVSYTHLDVYKRQLPGPPMLRIQAEALTYDDVSLVPAHSTVLPKDVSLETRLTRDLRLKLPIVSAAMDTVTEARLAIAMAQLGGIGIIHKNLTWQQQAAEVAKVKKFEAGVIKEPFTVGPDATIGDVLKLTRARNISGVPVVDGGQLVGIVTGRDMRFEKKLDDPVSHLSLIHI